MKIYCQKCGSATEYSFEKPKFCASCGNGFSIMQASKVVAPKHHTKITHDNDEEEIATERVPDNITRLEVEIEAPQNRKVTIQNLMGTQSQGYDTETSQGIRLNKKDVLESFKLEAGFYPSRQSMNEQEE